MSFLLVVVPILLMAPTARAANTEAKEREARTACLAGDPAKGVQLLSELFVATKVPTFIYNSGRCFEQNLRYEEAIGRFQEYLRVGKKLSQDDRADAERHIADCEQLLAKRRSMEAVAKPVLPLPPPPHEPVVTVAPTVVQQNAQSAGESGSGLRTAGIVTASVGVAAVFAGIIFNVKANNLVDDMKNVDGYTSSEESDWSTYKALTWVGYGAGAACIAGGAILYVLGMHSSAPSTSVALVPEVGPSQAGMTLKGAF
jgi:hypothetical protein